MEEVRRGWRRLMLAVVGMLTLTGIFAKDVGFTSGHAYTFLVHCGALVFVAAFSFAGSWVLYTLTDFVIPLRVSDEQEEIGLDRFLANRFGRYYASPEDADRAAPAPKIKLVGASA